MGDVVGRARRRRPRRRRRRARGGRRRGSFRRRSPARPSYCRRVAPAPAHRRYRGRAGCDVGR